VVTSLESAVSDGNNASAQEHPEEFQDLEQKYQALVEVTETGYVILDEEGRVVDANPAYLRLTGRETLEEIRGHPVTEWTAPHDLERNAVEVKKCIETGRVRHLEIDYFSPEGRIIPIEINATRLHTSKGIRIFTLCKDLVERRRSESAHRELESMFHAFLEHSPAYVFFKDAELRPIKLSRNFEQMIGRPLDQILGRTMEELFPPDMAASMIADDLRIIRNRELVKVDEELGGHFYTTLKFPVEQEGKPTILAGFTIDITDRKLAEKALQESEAKLRVIFEQAAVGMVEVSAEGRFLHTNPAFQVFLGYSDAELQERCVRDVTHPRFQEEDALRIAACVRGEIPRFVTEKIYVRKDGREIWGRVHVTLLRDRSGQPQNLVGIVEDIDERKRTEEDLALSEAKFRSLFESMIEGMAIHDVIYDAAGKAVNYRILDVNPAYEAHTGLSRDRCVGRLANEVYGTPSPPYLEEFCCVADDGIPKYYEVHFEPMRKHFRISVFAPRRGSFATIFEDITEQKKNEEERRRLEAEIQHAQKLESLGVLAGGVAHDMNNVLQAIQGMASVLKAKLAGDAALVSGLDIILSASNRGRDLVRNLTDFARKGLQEPKVFDLNEIVRKEVELLRHTTLQRIELQMTLAEDLPLVFGDPSAIGNALMNLCVNAIDAMPERGTLVFRTGVTGDGFVTMEIADSGQGMPSDVLARAAEPFFTTKPLGKGTGLGLSSVYGVMKAHGGAMDIQSEEGLGTCVTLRFPIHREAVETPPAPTLEVRRESPSSMRILLVDDDELIRESFPDLMNILGHTVVQTACCGREAFELMQSGLDVDVVVLDQNMPGWSGMETLERLHQLIPTLPVVLCTGHLDEDARQELQRCHHVWMLMKPFSIRDIRPLLAEVARSAG
jgi:PAS domain S-box-containing protein